MPHQKLYAMPSTRGQERFWSLDQLNPGNPALNMPLMWKCSGPLHLDFLSESFDRVVERHESLRTTFNVVGGKVMQIVGGPWHVPIPVVDLEGIPGAELSSEARKLTSEHAALRMNLLSGPLLAVKILRFGPESHLLLVTLHHIICDGVSTGILLRDVAAIYEALLSGQKTLLPKLPIQFPDFAIWQEEWRDSQEYAASLDFWIRSLGTHFTRIELKHDATESQIAAVGSDQLAGDIETLLLEQRLAEEVHEFCKRNLITHNVFFFSVFSILMGRISGQQDLLIGSPCANRVLQTEDLIGMFMNIQALRVKLEQDDRFMNLASKIQQWTMDAYENQQLPFEDLIYEPHFSSGSNSFELPIFFLYQKSFMVTHQIGDLTIVPLRSMSPGAAFEIMFAVVDREGEGPRLQLEYNPLKFQRATIRKYLELYSKLIREALESENPLLKDMLKAGIDLVSRPNNALNISANEEPGAIHLEPASGKRLRKELDAEHRTFRDPIEFQLVEIWQATLGIPSVTVDDGFFSLGVSSLTALRLITKINRLYSTDLGLSSLFSAPTIRAIADLIRDKLSPNMHSSLVPIQPLGSKPPLFVIHGLRGNILSFYGLVTHLGKDQPLYGIQAQALVTGEPALLKLPDMARYYIDEMRKLKPHGPYNLLGYSFGGTVALEMAHQLRNLGEEVGLLGMLDSKSPEYMKELQKTSSDRRKNNQAKQMAAQVVPLSRNEKIEQLLARVRARLIRTCCEIATSMQISKIPAYMKDPSSVNFVANARYKPQPYDGRMTLFRASRQAIPDASLDLGWGFYFKQGVDVRELPGTHETLWTEQNIGEFARSLAASLERYEADEFRRAG